MPARTPSTSQDEVKRALAVLGEHLREARLRRELSIETVAQQVGVSRKTVAEAERGKATTRIGVYAGMLGVLGLVSQLENLATRDMEPDDEFAEETDRKRAPRGGSGRVRAGDGVPFED
ncbi:MAG TPA: helix-turn-helix transcriptional regulator [Myxococcales bacterium]|jgi:predicted transcriptional regulator